MRKASPWRRRGLLLVFTISALSCAALAIRVLCGESNAMEGVATFSFNFTGHLPNNLSSSKALQERDILPNLQTEVNSIANGVATAIPGAVSQAGSAIGSVATAASSTIEEYIPKSCSLGTKQFCVRYSRSAPCKDLPLAISDFIPEGAQGLSEQAQNLLRDQVDGLQPLAGILMKVTPAYIRDCLIVGLVSILVIAAIFVSSVFGRLLCIGGILLDLNMESMITINFVLGSVCSIPLFIPAIVLCIFRSKSMSLPKEIEVDEGPVNWLCLGVLCFAIVMTFLTALAPALGGKRNRRGSNSEVKQGVRHNEKGAGKMATG